MTHARIQALENLDFEWEPSSSHTQGEPNNPILDDNATRRRERSTEPPEHMRKIAAVEKSAAIKSKSTPTSPRVERQKRRREEAGDTRFDEADLGALPLKSAAKANLHSESQAAKLLSSDKSHPAGGSSEELADYRNSMGTAMFLGATTLSWLNGLITKGVVTGCTHRL
jgi:hypothetical protein